MAAANELIAANKQIWYLSDLHFDNFSRVGKLDLDIRKKLTVNRVSTFIQELTKHPGITFVLAGDFFDDYQLTERFIDQLESHQIQCVLVLGNHDYWSEGTKTYAQVRAQLAQATLNNKFAHLLFTGRTVSLAGQTFIGDSGFTNFRYYENIERNPETLQIVSEPDAIAPDNFFVDSAGNALLPELIEVADWNIHDVIEMQREWIDFANTRIKSTSNLVVVTHWPMHADAPYKDPMSTWWQSKSGLLNTDTYWSIYGHTHHSGQINHDVSKQVGYSRLRDYSLLRFGKLVTAPVVDGLTVSGRLVQKYENFGIITAASSPEARARVKRQGYRRPGNADNKAVLRAWRRAPEEFIADVLRHVGKKVPALNGLINAEASAHNQNIDAVHDAVAVLKKGFRNNVFDFYTALIIAGYAYSGQLESLDDMRPLSIYDVARLYMQAYTVDYYKQEIDPEHIESIHRTKKKNAALQIGTIKIPIPNVNGYEVPIEQFADVQSVFNKILAAPKMRQQLSISGSRTAQQDKALSLYISQLIPAQEGSVETSTVDAARDKMDSIPDPLSIMNRAPVVERAAFWKAPGEQTYRAFSGAVSAYLDDLSALDIDRQKLEKKQWSSAKSAAWEKLKQVRKLNKQHRTLNAHGTSYQKQWVKHPLRELRAGMLVHHRSLGVGTISEIVDKNHGTFYADFATRKHMLLYKANGLVSDLIPKEYFEQIKSQQKPSN